MEGAVAATQSRVERHTAEEVNERIRRQLEANVTYYAGRLDEIERRLTDLEEEWDIERALEVNASSLALAGLGLSLVWSRKFLVLPLVVAGFFLQHGLQGWCPPVPLFRRMGVRTSREIFTEAYALKALRGDFHDVDGQTEGDRYERAHKALEAAGV